MSSLNPSVTFMLSQLASWFLEIRGFESISVFCVTAKITDVKSDVLVQKPSAIFFFLLSCFWLCKLPIISLHWIWVSDQYERLYNIRNGFKTGFSCFCMCARLNYFHRMILRSIVLGTRHTKKFFSWIFY